MVLTNGLARGLVELTSEMNMPNKNNMCMHVCM